MDWCESDWVEIEEVDYDVDYIHRFYEILGRLVQYYRRIHKSRGRSRDYLARLMMMLRILLDVGFLVVDFDFGSRMTLFDSWGDGSDLLWNWKR